MPGRVTALAMIAVLIGCSSKQKPAATPTEVDGMPAQNAPDQPQPTGALATFTRVGGIAGIRETLVIGADGSLTFTDRTGTVRKLTAADVRRLDELVRSPEFKALRASYSTDGADQMVYTVEVPRIGTVQTMDGVDNPEVLRRVLEESFGLMERARLEGKVTGAPGAAGR